jgi:hypothetical protein
MVSWAPLTQQPPSVALVRVASPNVETQVRTCVGAVVCARTSFKSYMEGVQYMKVAEVSQAGTRLQHPQPGS